MPFQSGREYRILKTTKKFFYQEYVSRGLVKNINILSYSYIFNKLLKNDSIHFSKDEIICEKCKMFEILSAGNDLNETEKNEFDDSKNHIEGFKKQIDNYVKIKNSIGSGKYGDDTILVVEDYSQLKNTKGSHVSRFDINNILL